MADVCHVIVLMAALLLSCMPLSCNAVSPMWSYDFPTPQSATNPVVFFDIVFVPTNTTLYAFRTETGVLLWNFTYPNNDQGGYVAVSFEHVYVGCINNMYTLNLFGELQWSFFPPANPSYPRPTSPNHMRPSVGDDAVYLTTGYTPLYRLRPSDGKLEWSSDDSAGVAQLHATEWQDRVFVVTSANGAVCLSKLNGTMLWSIPAVVTIIVAPEVGLLFSQGGNSTAAMLNANFLNDGSSAYVLTYDGMVALDYYVYGEALYVDVGPTQLPYPTTLFKVDGASGATRWAAQGVSFLFFVPGPSGVVNFGPKLITAFKGDTGVEKWQFPATAVNDGAVSDDGIVFTITATSVIAIQF